MKKILLTTTAVVALSVAANANAGGSHEGYSAKNANSYKPTDEAWYVSVSGLANFLDDQGVNSFDTGYGVLAAVGHEVDFGLGKGFRAEGEFGYKKADANVGELDAYSLMANAYYDFTNSSAFTPYVGAGIGTEYLDADGINATTGRVHDQDWTFAYQGIAGVNYAFNRNWSAQVEYRYIGTTDADLNSSTGASNDLNFDSSNVVAGVKYKFY